ncbi:hypothetical protein BE221DRAFT_71853 [Ostreococcus tauri]|uniref:DRBM domain-containing protein n=1 Tax=Ostreococcus tauri TaxID=70448 RepID=A0A1Y5ICF0_OSTTA|nr:hypothetical protein BE221DRAFT_71853 [Ostreococcus tauri]
MVPAPRTGPSARSQKRLRQDVMGGDVRFKRRVERAYGGETPGLEVWLELSGKLVANDILPTRLRDANMRHVSTTAVEMRALIGDKIFGAALLEEMVATELVTDTGEATRQYSLVASNSAMAQFVSQVLPAHVAGGRVVEEHSAGTLIEAAVYMVNQMPGGPQAVRQLARWFVYNIANPKGLILELNGMTSAERVPGTPDHLAQFVGRCIWPADNPEPTKEKEKKDAKLANAFGHLLTLGGIIVGGDAVLISEPGDPPRFVATMRYGNEEARAEASTKSDAKRNASRQLLELIGEYDD